MEDNISPTLKKIEKELQKLEEKIKNTYSLPNSKL
jgi:hypothetical protein